MMRFWAKVKLIFLITGLTTFSCFIISTRFVDNKAYILENKAELAVVSLHRHVRQQNEKDISTNKKLYVDDHLIGKIKEIAKLINEAKKHVRGSKTSDYLRQAITTMKDVLGNIGVDVAKLYSRSTNISKSVCPEKYMGSTYGYPFFHKGFEITNCTYGISKENLVTVVNVFDEDHNQEYVQTFLSSVYRTNPNLTCVISVDTKQMATSLNKIYPNAIIETRLLTSDGATWNSLVRQAKTPYVLIAKNVELLTNDSRLERLVREYESLNVVAAGGAFRESNGHWKKGCFQSVYRNFSLRYLEGYDESLHECLFCDYMEGPFLTSREYILQNNFDDFEDNGGLFEDWFLKVNTKGGEVVVCPDSMFHINERPNLKNLSEGKMSAMMKKWELYRMRTPCGHTVTQPCPPSKTNLDSPCNLQGNADAVKTVMKVCSEKRMFCELQEGTALGAVKLEKTLPWERDADITFLTANFTAFQESLGVLAEYGIKGAVNGKTWCCVDDRKAGGKFMLHYKGWHIELYGQHVMDSELMVLDGMNPSKVLLDGQWVTVPRNPGLFVRNRYGHECYQHAQHWLNLGKKSGWDEYKTNTFLPCSDPGAHHCLDRYNADGDLPFRDVLP